MTIHERLERRRWRSSLAAANGATLLAYSVNPSQAFVGLQTTLTITITNNTGAAISLVGGRNGDEMLLTIPAPPTFQGANALTNNIDFSCVALTPGYACGQQGQGSPTFSVRPMGSQTLAQGASIQVTIGPMTIDSTLGSPSIQVQEYIGTNTGTGAITVQKIPQTLAVIAWLSPWIVGLGIPSTLYWQSFGGTNVTVFGFPTGTGQKSFPVTGKPPSQTSTAVTVRSNESQRTYTAQVSTNDGKHAQTSVTLTQQPPLITSFATTPTPPPNPFDPSTSILLNWTTLFSSRVYLLTPRGQMNQAPPNPSAPMSVSPGLDALAGAASPSQIPPNAIYQLSAQGYLNTPTQAIVIQLGPMGVLYFKYMQMDNQGNLSSVAFELDGPWPNGSQMVQAPNLNTLTVYQPGGGATVMYLGPGDTVHPQVRYFNYAPAQGGGFTLTWVTANLTSLVLNPGNYQVPAAQTGKGTHTVTPSVDTAYVLTGTAANGQTVTSTLDVEISGKD
ncbi:MAG TPA: hypothetical protein VIX89_13575 [Bryobacteraceae bacterium]